MKSQTKIIHNKKKLFIASFCLNIFIIHLFKISTNIMEKREIFAFLLTME